MPASNPIPIRTDLVMRPAPSEHQNASPRNAQYSKHKHTRSSYSESSPLTAVSRNNSLSFRPLKRSTPSPDKTIAVINASGRQAASLIRIATAVGFKVRAQLRNLEGVIATEVSTNPNVTVFVGELYIRKKPGDSQDVTAHGDLPGLTVNHDLITQVFRGAQLAFINTTFYGNEIQIGQALADAAKEVDVQHLIYSSMPDHAKYNKAWPSLPLWAAKHEVEDYIRKIGLPATFVYTGIYNNNFTSLVYPLFCMELQPDGSFEWQAPFHPDAKLPWLDAEHDVGPAIIQLFKDGPSKWNGARIALAYEYLTPLEACKAFENGVGRPVRYKRGPIQIKVKIPNGYRVQLEALEKLFSLENDDPAKQPPYFGDQQLDDRCPADALGLWEGPRGLEEYAGEIFPMEEEANGKTWMFDDEDEDDNNNINNGNNHTFETVVWNDPIPEVREKEKEKDGNESDESVDEGLVMRGLKRDEEDWLA
ncbi:NmrA-like family-domain-containing protein [Xylariaceae sp. FL0255]|nr:NmrA-like family-domain-containing protein [Xylariaceae sp. FL0255]